MIRPLRVSSKSAFLEQQCALCKEEFVPGDEMVICPEDGARHHAACWQANGSKCSAFGCTGKGQIATGAPPEAAPQRGPRVVEHEYEEGEKPSKVRVLPSSSLGCAQTCLILSIAFAIVVMALGCFGLWAIFDYLMLNYFNMDYRAPLEGAILPMQMIVMAYWG